MDNGVGYRGFSSHSISLVIEKKQNGLRRRDSGYPEAPATDPDVQFSRIRFLGRKFRGQVL